MPRHTESKIDELCTIAKGAKTEREAQRVLGQLRSALSEHIGLARESLEAQVSALKTLEAKTKTDLPKIKKPKLRKRPEKSLGSEEDPSSPRAA